MIEDILKQKHGEHIDQLWINENRNGMTAKDIANKHGVPVKDITLQLNKGIKEEMEHTDSDQIAKEIALDHLFKDPKYYNKLEKMEESTQRQLIRKLIRENIELMTTDETPDTTTYDIYYKNRPAGKITCGSAPESLGEDTHEIVSLFLEDEYTNINVANQAVKALWKAKPDINRFVVSLPNASHIFWEKLGFQRLNDDFHMLMRGH